jgi:subtilisin family serine protease
MTNWTKRATKNLASMTAAFVTTAALNAVTVWAQPVEERVFSLPQGLRILKNLDDTQTIIIGQQELDLKIDLKIPRPEIVTSPLELARDLELKTLPAVNADIVARVRELQNKKNVDANAEVKVNSLVQLNRALTDVEISSLKKRGFVIEAGGAGNTYSVTLSNKVNIAETLGALNLTWKLGLVKGLEEKLTPTLGPNIEYFYKLTRSPDGMPIFVSASRGLASKNEKDSFVKSLKEAGATSVEELFDGRYLVRTDAGNIPKIADLEDVVSVDGGPPPFIPLAGGSAEKVYVAIKLTGLQNFVSATATADYDGTGTRIAIFDDGIDENHKDFRTFDRFALRIAPVWTASNGHGTAVAGIAAGNGSQTDPVLYGPYGARGVAFKATIAEYGAYTLQASSPPTSTLTGGFVLSFDTLLRKAITEENIDVSNHSYVETLREYSDFSSIIDSVISGKLKDRKDIFPAVARRPQVWAAGNNGVKLSAADTRKYGNRTGYFTVFTQAKNSISVGSVDLEVGGQSMESNFPLSPFSSRGPTFDGRIKPDIVAPGCVQTGSSFIVGPVNQNQGHAQISCGTSFAAPVVSGVIALMTQAMRKSSGNSNLNPLPSTFKVLLVHGATDLTRPAPPGTASGELEPLKYGTGPDFATGFGMLDAKASIETAQKLDHWMEGEISTQSASMEKCIVVSSNTEPLRLSLAWDDPPGSFSVDNSTRMLVHDLDIRAWPEQSPSTIAQPWVLNTLPRLTNLADIQAGLPDPIRPNDITDATKGDDSVNNVEVIDVASPQAGRWRIKISKKSQAPLEFEQDFSVASTQPLSDC